jgi:hydrogenase-4 component B
VDVAARAVAAVSTALALAGITLAALSGFPGLALPRDHPAGDRAGALLLGLAALCAAAASLIADTGPPVATLALPWRVLGERVTVGVDGLSAFFLLPALGIPFAASVYALAYYPAVDRPHSARRLRLAFGFLTAGLGTVVIARHAFAFLAGWEVMALAAFFSITAEDEREEVRRAGFVYLACTRASTLALFGAFAWLHAATGRFTLEAVPEIAPAASTAIFALAGIGFALKAGAVPLHLWLPGAHANAPSHVSAVLSGVLIKVGIYGIVRFASLLPPLPVAGGAAILALGAASAVLGVAYALGQHEIKRLLAYHSVENIGIILMGVGVGLLGRSLGRPEVELLGLGGALLHVWNHALFKGLLFLAAGSVIHASGTGEIDRLGGLARRLPHTALLFCVGAVAICGLPPLNGFVSELLVCLGLLHAAVSVHGSARLVAVVAIATLALVGGLAAACFAKVFGSVFLGAPRTPAAESGHEAPRAMLVPMAALALCCLAIGTLPLLVLDSLQAALFSFDPVLAYSVPNLTWTLAAPLGVVSVAAAMLLAAAAAVAALVTRRPVRRGPTWDCGYAVPSARMQYTASSFAGGLVNLFHWALWTEHRTTEVAGPFPGPARLATDLPDPVLDRIVLPAARWVTRVSLWARWLQRGHVHSYVLYILIAVIAALIAARGEFR